MTNITLDTILRVTASYSVVEPRQYNHVSSLSKIALQLPAPLHMRASPPLPSPASSSSSSSSLGAARTRGAQSHGESGKSRISEAKSQPPPATQELPSTSQGYVRACFTEVRRADTCRAALTALVFAGYDGRWAA